jgi:thymidylate kinase
MLIVILGPDGSGKTSLAKLLANNNDNLTYIYFGNNIESRNYTYFKSFLQRDKKGFFFTFFKYIFIFINDFNYYYLAKKKNMIADRCPVDKILGAKLKKDKLRFIYQKFSQALMRSPDYVILLHGDAKVIYDRTKEISEEKIEYYIKFYRNHIAKYKIPFIEIDTTLNDLESSFQIANSNIQKILEK